jgi:hypothetical protein
MLKLFKEIFETRFADKKITRIFANQFGNKLSELPP